MIHAVARALRRHPRLNSSLADGTIILAGEINIGMAVALEEGLIVPVIHGADRKVLKQIATETKDLGRRAREGKLRVEEVEGGTFTITNLGTYGVDAFTPIINSGQAAILGLGRIVERPAVYRSEIVRRSMMTLSLTFDHRIVDGAPAAAFYRPWSKLSTTANADVRKRSEIWQFCLFHSRGSASGWRDSECRSQRKFGHGWVIR